MKIMRAFLLSVILVSVALVISACSNRYPEAPHSLSFNPESNVISWGQTPHRSIAVFVVEMRSSGTVDWNWADDLCWIENPQIGYTGGAQYWDLTSYIEDGVLVRGEEYIVRVRVLKNRLSDWSDDFHFIIQE